MMNRLSLSKRLRLESGIAGDGPATTLNNSGQLERVVAWVDQAWVNIQLMRTDWRFMVRDFAFDTEAGRREYVAADESISDLKLWEDDSFLIYNPDLGAIDQRRLMYVRWDEWQSDVMAGMNARPLGYPERFTIDPANRVVLDSSPNRIYRIDGSYKRSTQQFSSDVDVPTLLPDDFHMMIVWEALKSYAGFEDAPEVMDRAETNFDNLLNRLQREQLPAFNTKFKSLT